MSDPISDKEPATLEIQVEDALAVLDEVRAKTACVLSDNGGHAGILLAAEHPDRVTHLVLDHPIAVIHQTPQNPRGIPPTLIEHEVETAEEEHRSGLPLGFIRSLPSVMGDPAAMKWFLRAIRRGASPGTMRSLVRVLLEADVTSILPTVQDTDSRHVS